MNVVHSTSRRVLSFCLQHSSLDPAVTLAGAQMTLRRSNTRSQSRSPAPPQATGLREDRHYPPSHYANSAQSVYSPPMGEHGGGKSDYMPLSCHTVQSSESSFEFKPADDMRFQSTAKNRQSRLQNVPQLETLLLPSLRDTIDKMTRPPSRNPTVIGPPGTPNSHLGVPIPTSTRPSSPSRISYYSSSVPSTPKPPPSPTPATPKPKSALKSALRAPTPKVSLSNPIEAKPSTPKMTAMQTLNAGVHSLSRGGSLKSVKNLIGAGRSKTPTPPAEPALIETEFEDKTGGRKARTRSRTDPGESMDTHESKSEPKRARFAQAPAPSHQDNFVSGLPRRARSAAALNPAFDSQSSDSDIEGKFDREARGRRQLIVTNAHVVASSSSDSSDIELRTPDRQTRLPVPSRSRQATVTPNTTPGPTWARNRSSSMAANRALHKPKPIIGLGLVRPQPQEDYRLGQQHVESRRFSDETARGMDVGDDDISVYDDDGDDYFERVGRQLRDSSDEGTRRQRREALMGLVDTLSSLEGRSVHDDGDESDYGQRGLAVGGLDEMRPGYQESHRGHSNASLWTTPKDAAPPFVTESPVPTFVVSMGETQLGGRETDESRYRATSHQNTTSTDTSRQHVKDASRRTRELPRYSDRHGAPSRRVEESRLPTSAVPETNVGRKSPSRSPIIRQNVALPDVPHTRRNSLYHATAVTILRSGLSKPSPRLPLERRPSPSPVVDELDAISIAESVYMDVNDSRERDTFGIPPSASACPTGTLPHADSDLSSVGSILWNEETEGLSMGAEALFNQFRDSEESAAEVFSVASSSSSIYEPEPEEEQRPLTPSSPDVASLARPLSWKEGLDSHAYDSLLDQHGPTEIQRQEVIWEIFHSEEDFVGRLTATLRLFITPLRVQNTQSWIAGVPVEVARLFDWLDDIVNLHSQILEALRAAVTEEMEVVVRLAEALRGYVPKLEVYQPYLVRVEDVAGMIGGLVEEGNSDFGEFVRIQEMNSTCGSLEDFLEEPVERLTKYLELFRRLLEFTPALHPDHLPTFALLHSIDMVIRVMSEVKTREDEYDLVKDVSSRIEGIPPSVHLARRERRLLAQGPLLHCSPQSPSLSVSSRRGGSSLVDAIQDWDSRRGRSNSVKSTASSAVSFRSHKTAWSPPASSTVHVFVFTDIVLLAAPLRQEDGQDPRWRLLDRFGMSRIIGFQGQNEDGWTLSLLPTLDLDAGVITDNTPLAVVNLELSKGGLTPHDEDLQKKWTSAFQQCYSFTLRSLSIPSHSGRYLVHGPNVNLEADTRETVLSLLGSGLPIPKSPSIQIEESASGGRVDDRQKEREERGWWSLRFQQVLKEMQRQDPVLTLA